jgi:hypothetical protein
MHDMTTRLEVDVRRAAIARIVLDTRPTTVRATFYVAVTKGLVPKNKQGAAMVGNDLTWLRRHELVAWDDVRDSLRAGEDYWAYDDVSDGVSWLADQYRLDPWTQQDMHVEVWVESASGASIIRETCQNLRVPLVAMRGQSSLSLLWDRSKVINQRWRLRKQSTAILYLGDFDPTGLGIDDQIQRELDGWCEPSWSYQRIAIIESDTVDLPTSYTAVKMSDPRARAYVDRFGNKTWELEAIPPGDLRGRVDGRVRDFIDEEQWDATLAQEEADRAELQEIADERSA